MWPFCLLSIADIKASPDADIRGTSDENEREIERCREIPE